jgi:UDP-glucuronate 4-epimerase
MNKKILITGGAGFIGSHLIDRLMSAGNVHITCLDNFNSFYSPDLKKQNIATYINDENFKLIEGDICIPENFSDQLLPQYDAVVHLAALAGVRPSIEAPANYQLVNVVGLQNVLDIAKQKGVKSFVFGSSSSVYGINPDYPWAEQGTELMPISPYAASKISGEWLGKSYSLLYGLRFVALRFFTVFGPRQRPDLAINKFTRQILNDQAINFFGNGNTIRDYTFVSDIVDGIIAALEYTQSDFEIFNLGNNNPISLAELVKTIEQVLGKKAIYNYLPEQPGDVPITYANIEKAKHLLGYQPKIDIRTGLSAFVDWHKEQLYVKG